MSGFSAFHAFAARRGDGLLPELAALLAEPVAPNVVDLAFYRSPPAVIIGPAPALPTTLPDNVVYLRPNTEKVDVTARPVGRRPRIGKAKSLARRQS